MNMFRLNAAGPPWRGLGRILQTGVVMIPARVAGVWILYLTQGGAGLSWLPCTCPLTALVGSVAGGTPLPDGRADEDV